MGTSLTSADGINWNDSDPWAGTSRHGLCVVSGSTLVAAGGSAGSLFAARDSIYTADGASWGAGVITEIGHGAWDIDTVNALTQGSSEAYACALRFESGHYHFLVAASTDLITWNVRQDDSIPTPALPVDLPVYQTAIESGSYLIVAGQNIGVGGPPFQPIGLSIDGEVTHHYAVTTPFDSPYLNTSVSGLADSGTRLVAVGSYYDGSNYITIASSDDNGVTWTLRRSGTSSEVGQSVAYSAALGQFVACGSWVGGAILTSPDGITWTARASPFTGSTAACWSPTLGLWVLCGDSLGDRHGHAIATSPNGTAWTAAPPLFKGTPLLSAATWSAALGLFVIVGRYSLTAPWAVGAVQLR